jgi:hypothetical protein
MKLIKNPARVAAALLCLGSAGCETHKMVAPVDNGYEEVTHPSRSSTDETDLTRISFQYRDSDGRIIQIWPSLYGVKEVVKGSLAIFVGDVSYAEGNSKGTWPRLFAVQSPALPVDITDEVLFRWSKTAGKDFAQALNKFSLVTPLESGGGLELQLEFDTEGNDWPDRVDLQLDWNEVSDIIRTVKAKGVVIKDLKRHSPFIEEKL